MHKLIREKILKIKKIYSIVSLTLFIAVLTFCVINTKELNLSETSLSNYGIHYKTEYIWNISLFILGILLYLHALRSIFRYYSSGQISSRLVLSFTISSLCLLLTASIDMNYKIHDHFALLYFIGYIVSIFLFGWKLLVTDFRIGISSILISLCCLVFPILTTYLFKGWAIPEIIHTLFILIWVIMLSFDTEYKNLIKKIGF